MATVTTGGGGIFREEALSRYAASRQRGELLRDVSALFLISLWVCVGLLGTGLIGVAVYIFALLRWIR